MTPRDGVPADMTKKRTERTMPRAERRAPVICLRLSWFVYLEVILSRVAAGPSLYRWVAALCSFTSTGIRNGIR
jgi:hypothetical protein